MAIVALAVERAPERVDDAPEQLLADGDLEQRAGALDGVALGDPLPLAEQHRADVVGLEVQREAGDAVGQLEHLEGHAVLEAVQARDAVGHRQHGADLGQLGAAAVESLDAALEDACDLVGIDLHVCLLRGSLGNVPAQLLQSVADRGVEDRVADPDDDAAEDVGVHARCQRDLAPGALADRAPEALGRRLVELDRARDLDGQRAVLLLPQPLVLAGGCGR